MQNEKKVKEMKLPEEIVFPTSKINVVYIRNRLTDVDKKFIKEYLEK